jgi:hypothetical protein
MSSPIGEVVRGYTNLATSLLEQWGDHAAKLAAKVDGGELDGPAMAAELVSCATLATRSGLEMVEEAIDAAAILSGTLAAEKVVTSRAFHAPAGATLKLREELEIGAGLGFVKKGAVTIDPSQLGPEETEFRIRVDTSELHGGTYVGAVEKCPDDPEPIVVWITIP